MIHTAKQLKDKVKNMSGGNSEVAQALIRTYFMEDLAASAVRSSLYQCLNRNYDSVCTKSGYKK